MVSIMNNINLGVDIVLVDRINKILNSKTKSRFLNKIFSHSEISDSKNRQNQSEYFSGRFAAKEAIKKAIYSSGIINSINFNSIEIISDDSGVPEVRLSCIGLDNILVKVSISHIEEYAIAFALVSQS